MTEITFNPEQVLDLWFPNNGHQNDRATHERFWNERMQGGMDGIICEQFADLTMAAARGELDHWAETPRGRLALLIAISHCEGPDHLQRFDLIDDLSEGIVARLPEQLADMAEMLRSQNARVRGIIERFGRHPHRNPIYGRVSTPEEEAYIATGDFPHVRKVEA